MLRKKSNNKMGDRDPSVPILVGVTFNPLTHPLWCQVLSRLPHGRAAADAIRSHLHAPRPDVLAELGINDHARNDDDTRNTASITPTEIDSKLIKPVQNAAPTVIVDAQISPYIGGQESQKAEAPTVVPTVEVAGTVTKVKTPESQNEVGDPAGTGSNQNNTTTKTSPAPSSGMAGLWTQRNGR